MFQPLVSRFGYTAILTLLFCLPRAHHQAYVCEVDLYVGLKLFLC